MSYLPPAVVLHQEFLALNSSATQTFNACVVGPNYRTFSYGTQTDRPLIGLGAYNPQAGGVFTYPSLPAGGVVSQGSVSLVLDTVLAQFATLSGADVVRRSASAVNEIVLQAGAVGAFQANASAGRLAALGTRDLAIGDAVKITGATSGATVTTAIQSFSQSVVPASAGAFTPGAANQAAQAESATVTPLNVNGNHVATVFTGNGLYAGSLAAGILSDTYTLTCTTAGAGTAAVFAVTSLQGDSVGSVNAPVLGGEIPVGTRGLAVTISGTGNYVVGESYQIAVQAAFATQLPAIVSPAYTGPVSTTYQVKVLKGGAWNTGPILSISSLNGSDYQSPVTVAFNTSFPVGTLGLTAKFASATVENGLLAGDTYLVTATAASAGAVTGLYTVDPLPAALTTGEDLSLNFYLSQTSVTVPAVGYPFAGNTALAVTGTEVTVVPNLEIVNAQFVDALGDLIALPVVSANLYLQYSALLTAQANVFQSLSDLASVQSVLGSIVSSNPLAYAVNKALLNSAGQTVNFVAIDQDNLQGYTDALAVLESNATAYFCVPATDHLAVRQLFQAHEQAMSAAGVGMERVALGGNYVAPTLTLYGQQANGSYWTGYVGVNPASPVTVYTKLTVPGATFLAATSAGTAVRAGDVVQTEFALNAQGVLVSQSATVASVLDNQNLLLTGTGFGVAVGSVALPVRVAIVRTPAKSEYAATAAAQSGAFADRRFYSVLPNRDPAASTSPGAEPLWGYAAAVAGLKSAVAPQQGITNATLVGFSEGLQFFTPTQLNVVAGGGTLILTQDSAGGAIYVRHQLSTDMTDANSQEMSITVNNDSIAKYLRALLKPFLGRWNNTATFIQQVKTVVLHAMNYLNTQTATVTAGPQVTSFDPANLSVAADATTRTLTDLSVQYGLPYPCNNINGTLTVV